MHVKFILRSLALFIIAGLPSGSLRAQVDSTAKQFAPAHNGGMILLFLVIGIVLMAAIFLKIKTSEVVMNGRQKKKSDEEGRLNQYISNMESKQIDEFIEYKQGQKKTVHRRGAAVISCY